jgi:hypothetical protein
MADDKSAAQRICSCKHPSTGRTYKADFRLHNQTTHELLFSESAFNCINYDY